MSNFILLTNWNTVQSALTPVNPVDPWGNVISTAGPPLQTFQLTITGTAGNVSGTAQILVSNDGTVWYKYGDPMIAPSTFLLASTALSGNQGWNLFGAILTAISGTGAVANLVMSA